MDDELFTKELEPLDATKSAAVRKAFEPMVKTLTQIEVEYAEIVKLETSPETCGKARSLRLRIQKVRKKAEEAKTKEKEQYLIGGNAVQAFFNIFKAAVTPTEKKLKEIEEYYEREAQEKIDKLQEERVLFLEEYELDGSQMKLGEMEEDVWKNYSQGVKSTFLTKQAEENEVTEAQKIKDEQYKVLKERKEELMPYAQFNPFIDLFPETTEEEYQEILAFMKKQEQELSDDQLELVESKQKVVDENAELKAKLAKLREDNNITKGFPVPTKVEELSEEKEDFKKKTLRGLFGTSPATEAARVFPEKEEPADNNDKDVLKNLSLSLMKRHEVVVSKAAKDAIRMAANTLDMAAMML